MKKENTTLIYNDMKNIKTFKLFENNIMNTDDIMIVLNNTSDEFWEMVKIVDWDKVIKEKSDWNRNSDDAYIIGRISINRNSDDAEQDAKMRLYKSFEYDEIEKFYDEYHDIQSELYEQLEDNWLNEPGYGVSDDGYSDLLSSIIGKGKEFIISVINDPTIPVEMVKTNSYAENFGYLLNVDYEDKDKLHKLYYDL